MRKIFFGVVLAVAACVPILGSAAVTERTLYLNGRVWTGSDGKFAEALLVDDGKIVRVGASTALRADATDATIVDLEGRFVAPGFIDNHTHFMGGALDLARLNLRDVKTPAEFARRVGEAVKGGYCSVGFGGHLGP